MYHSQILKNAEVWFQILRFERISFDIKGFEMNLSYPLPAPPPPANFFSEIRITERSVEKNFVTRITRSYDVRLSQKKISPNFADQ